MPELESISTETYQTEKHREGRLGEKKQKQKQNRIPKDCGMTTKGVMYA